MRNLKALKGRIDARDPTTGMYHSTSRSSTYKALFENLYNQWKLIDWESKFHSIKATTNSTSDKSSGTKTKLSTLSQHQYDEGKNKLQTK